MLPSFSHSQEQSLSIFCSSGIDYEMAEFLDIRPKTLWLGCGLNVVTIVVPLKNISRISLLPYISSTDILTGSDLCRLSPLLQPEVLVV